MLTDLPTKRILKSTYNTCKNTYHSVFSTCILTLFSKELHYSRNQRALGKANTSTLETFD